MAISRLAMTDEQRKSVALEYLKAFDNGGVTSSGDSILSLFADDAQVYFPKWGLANGKDQIGQMFGDVGATLKSIVHHYSHFNWIFSGSKPSTALSNIWRGGDFSGKFTGSTSAPLSHLRLLV